MVQLSMTSTTTRTREALKEHGAKFDGALVTCSEKWFRFDVVDTFKSLNLTSCQWPIAKLPSGDVIVLDKTYNGYCLYPTT